MGMEKAFSKRLLGSLAAFVLLIATISSCGGEPAAEEPPPITPLPVEHPAARMQEGKDIPATKPPGTPITKDETTTDTPPEVAPLESGTVAVYYMSHTGSSSDVQRVYDTETGKAHHIKIEHSVGGTFCYLPEQGQTFLVEEFDSASYASWEIYPYTVDGRLFMVDYSSDTYGGDFSEYDPKTNHRIAHRIVCVSLYNHRTSAIVENSLYYQERKKQNMLRAEGYEGLKLYVKDLGYNQKERYLLYNTDEDNYGDMYSAGGRLYRVSVKTNIVRVGYKGSRYESVQEDEATINRIDLDTGKIARYNRLFLLGKQELDSGEEDYVVWDFAADADALYIAAVKTPERIINLWRLSWIDYETYPKMVDNKLKILIVNSEEVPLVYSYKLEDERDSFQGLDADEGYVLIDLFCWGEATMLLYDHNTGTASVLHPDREGSYAQVLKVR